MSYLITKYPFFAYFLRRCNIEFTTKIPTAGVTVTKSCDIKMLINMEFFKSLNEEQRVGLLMHEVYHLVLKHLSRGKALNQQLFNMAADIALNQYIPAINLPNGALTPELFKLERDKSAEWYYKALLNHPDIEFVQGNSQTLDDHSMWDDAEKNGLSEQEVNGKLDRMTVGAYQETKELWGEESIPIQIKEDLETIFKNSKFAWKNELKNLMGRKISSETIYTRKRANRRFGLKAAGKSVKYNPKILIAIDCSGSVSEQQYNEVFTFIKPLLKEGHEARLVFFDTKVSKNHYDVKKLDKIPGRPLSGGTCFDCVINYSNEYKPDLTVIFTDGYAELKERPNNRLLWLNFSGTSNSGLPGKEIMITFP